MSINVTVSGNPVSIKRGKMVTIDPVFSKEEYDKRRIMRLEQVRQQSRDIAGKVRNKVHKEKIKQMKKIQEEGREKLGEWKNRKLLELQSQYKEALKEFASGHEEAEVVEEKLHDTKKEEQQNKFRSLQRGREAGMKLQVDKNKENLKKFLPLQSKKLTRDNENARAAALISKPEKSVSNKKQHTSINISIDSSCDADQFDIQDFEDFTPDEMEMSPQESNEGYESPRQPLKKIENIEHIPKVTSCSTENNLFLENLSEPQSPQPDTRISDQIKKRNKYNLHSDYCDMPENSSHIPYVADNMRIRSTIHSPVAHLNSEKSSAFHFTQECQRCLDCDNSQCVILEKPGFNQKLIHKIPASNGTFQDSNNLRKLDLKKIDYAEIKAINNQPSAEIPLKAPIKIKEVPLQENPFSHNAMKFNKVQYYDHCNKFVTEKEIPADSFVEKLGAESVEAITNTNNDDKLLKERDREANLRGRKALATERVKKDYEDMMKRLPVLQKKEKILELKRDKPEHHMSGHRLKNVERIRQNKLENAFNKIFPGIKPATITLPKVNKELESEIPENKNNESIQSIDLNKCKIDDENHKNFSMEEVQEIVSSFTQQKCEDRKTKLKELLNSLKLQKDELIKELKGVARGQDNSINDLINDLISFDNQIVGTPSKTKDSEKQPSRKRRYSENDPMCENTVSSSTMSERLGSRRSKKDKTPKCSFASRKKSKSKAKYIILQNAGTQTTPKTSIQNSNENGAQIKPSTMNEVLSTKICKKKHLPCDCKDFAIPEELCRILINLNEEKPALIVESDYLRQEKAGNALNRPDSNLPFVANENKMEESQLTGIKKLDTTASDITNSRTRKTGNEFEKRAKQVYRKAYKDKKNTTSWRDHLGIFSASTSSTSYMSPPDIQKPISRNKVFSINRKNYDSQSKSKQNNLYDAMLSSVGKLNSNDKIYPQIAEYIEKLLGMSRGSIENLNISSTSSVTTPSQSLIELESNNPISHFQELLKQLSSKIGKAANKLSVSPDQSPIHFNTSVTTSEEIQRSVKEQIVAANRGKENGQVKLCKRTSKEGLLEQYAEITDSCSKRIASLTAMIQQIRNEKIEMLHGTGEFDDQVKSALFRDKELSSAYIDSTELKCSKNNLQSSSSSTSLSTDEEDILSKLLDVDVSLARKLKKLKDVEVKDSGIIENTANIDIKHLGTGDLQERLECLTKSGPHDGGGALPSTLQNEHLFSFLSDIPKLPKYPVELENAVIKNNKRPPPSKGLSIAKKFNENILLVPHELSTIVEADSQLSTKIGNRPPSPIMTKLSPSKDIETSSPEISNKITETQLPDKSPIGEIFTHHAANKTDSSITSTVSRLSHSKTPHTSSDSLKQCSSSNDDIETIEVMLKSIGMDWAIPTLHKTKEALALSSSSASSFEVLQKQNLFGNNAYSCDINFLKSSLAKQLSYSISSSNSVSSDSLKSLLAKKLSYKISSSNSVSDDSSVSFLREFSNFSAFQEKSKEQQRTSTPLTTSKSNDADVFSIETDISSVKYTVNQS